MYTTIYVVHNETKLSTVFDLFLRFEHYCSHVKVHPSSKECPTHTFDPKSCIRSKFTLISELWMSHSNHGGMRNTASSICWFLHISCIAFSSQTCSLQLVHNSTNRPETRVVTVTVNQKAYTWQICDPHKLTCIVPHNYTSLSQTIYLRSTYLKQPFFFKEISILMNHGQSIYFR